MKENKGEHTKTTFRTDGTREHTVDLRGGRAERGDPEVGEKPRSHHTYFYEPLTAPEALEKAVHWALGLEGSFVISAGDVRLLRPMLEAAERFKKAPSEEEMKALAKEYQARRIFG